MDFIENVEGFYNGITFLKRELLYARVKKDEKKEMEMISEMESYLFHLKQFFETIMERKDSIVDLVEVWHDIAEPADRDGYVLLSNHPKLIEKAIQGQEIWGESICKGAKYAYIEDLLPKGGEK